MPKDRPIVMSIAGYDPSGGAGLLADIKTIEQHKAYGVGVPTAMTWQNHDTFEKLTWYQVPDILDQISLFKAYKVGAVKIGIIENTETLTAVLNYLRELFPKAYIILDPVVRSSSGKDLSKLDIHNDVVVKNLDMLTPNAIEAGQLLGGEVEILEYASKVSVYVKGGHKEKKGVDTLYTSKGAKNINPRMNRVSEKHGSGCVLSSALASNIALGYPVLKACLRAKEYTEKVLASNTSLLGYHNR